MVTLQCWVSYGLGKTAFRGSSEEGSLIQTQDEQVHLSSKIKLANVHWVFATCWALFKHMAHMSTFNLHQKPMRKILLWPHYQMRFLKRLMTYLRPHSPENAGWESRMISLCRKMAAQRCPIIIPKTYEYLTLHGKGELRWRWNQDCYSIGFK